MTNQSKSNRGQGYQRLISLFDDGTFAEIGAYIKRKDSDEEYEGVVCGYGSVNGRLVFAFSQDSDRLSGAVDEYHAKKIEALYKAAIRNGVPVVGIFDSKGAALRDGISSVSAYGRIAKCVSSASGRIPQIAIIDGVCAGSMAAIAEMFDIVVAIKDKSLLYFAAPSLVGNEHGGAESLTAKGLASIIADDTEKAFEITAKIIEMLPDNCECVARVECTDSPSRPSVIGGNAVKNIRSLVDEGSFVELFRYFSATMITGIATLGGVVVGIIANDPTQDNGRLTAEAALEASKLIEFADSYSLPIITLVDSYGAKISKEEEDTRIATSLASLAMAYTSSTTAKVTLICGSAYGASAVFMGSKAMGADVVLAVPGASIGALSPEASVAFLENNLVGKEGSREELEERWRLEKLSAERAAEVGEIDDIVTPEDARARLCSAVYMLSEANIKLNRKHTIAPL